MPTSAVTILTYHRIATPTGQPDLAPGLIDAYPSDFEAQMRYVAKRYNVISFHDVVRALKEGYTLPRRALVITFDDGYRCFKDAAWPLLSQLGLPVTLFVPTYYASHPEALFWWDDIHRALARTAKSEIDVPGVGRLPLTTPEQRQSAVERLVSLVERTGEQAAAGLVQAVVARCEVEPNTEKHLLGWDEIEALAASGLDVGPHTRHHTILAQTKPEHLQSEIEGSWEDLRSHVSNPLPVFCYPNGLPHAINKAAVDTVRKAGLAGGCTTVAGLNVMGRTNPYLLYRVGMVAGESLRRFTLKISTTGRIYRRVKAFARRHTLPTFNA